VRVVEHATVSAFLARAEAWLLAAEVERALILGLCADLKTQGVAGGPPCLVTLEDGDAVVSASMRTPPYNLVVSRAPTSAFGVLATWLGERDGTIPGVEGPTVDAGVFAEGWVAATGVAARRGLSQRLYECRAVVPDVPRVSGALRPAREDDVRVLAEWMLGFHRDTQPRPVAGRAGFPETDLGSRVRTMIGADRLFVWEDARAVAMAAVTGPTPHGCRLSYVYTPPALRRRGYATATVAALTARLLGQGRRFCCLYTDLANPTSNGIYQRIGYRPVCDWQQHLFIGVTGGAGGRGTPARR